MENTHQIESKFPGWAILLLFLIVPVAFYWRHDLFFLWDDWTELDFVANNTFINYLTIPDGEIFFPFFHLIFYALLKLAGERYSILVMVNCLATGITGFLAYQFFKRHFSFSLALGLSLLYAGSVVQQPMVWNAFYLCYILCWIFFISALLFTINYLQCPSKLTLFGMGICSWLSIHSHNYTVLAILLLPFYIFIMEGRKAIKRAIPIGIIVGIILVSFTWEYLTFAGLHAMTFFNQDILVTRPSLSIIPYWLVGAFLSPAYFVFGGHLKIPLWSIIIGSIVFTSCLSVNFLKGGSHERRLTTWALLLNAIPFLLLSFGRYTFSVEYALSARYVFFTLFGTLLMVGTTLTILRQKIFLGAWSRQIPAVLLTIMILGQIFSTPFWQRDYLDLTHLAFDCYQKPERFRDNCPFIVDPKHPLGQQQITNIKRFFKKDVWL